jgi:hypothetical protein
VQYKQRRKKYGENMRNETRTQSLITEFVPRMDYVSETTSKWRGLSIISAKIGINTWIYLKTENGLKICCPDAKSELYRGLVVRKCAKMIIHMSNFVTSHPRTPLTLHLIMHATKSALNLMYLHKIMCRHTKLGVNPRA